MTDPEKLLPREYQDFLPLFPEVNANRLPPHRPYDHKIHLKERFETPFGPLYFLSGLEMEELKKWEQENLVKGFIKALLTPCIALIVFVKKKDGRLRFCVDHRKLNEGTLKNCYAILLI